MTKLELTIRRVSDLRDFYIKIRTNMRIKNDKAGTTRRSNRPVKSAAKRLRQVLCVFSTAILDGNNKIDVTPSPGTPRLNQPINN